MRPSIYGYRAGIPESAGDLIRFAMPGQNVYLEAMPQKLLDLPMQVAKAFVEDMKAYFAEPKQARSLPP